MTEPTILIVPGLRDHVPAHWQTLLAARLDRVRAVPPMGRADLDCRTKVEAIEREARAIDGPVIIVAHSGGAARSAPPDFERPMPEGPTIAELRAGGWLPVARASAVPEHCRGEPQRSAGSFRARRGARRLLGRPAGRPRRGRPPQFRLRLWRMAGCGSLYS